MWSVGWDLVLILLIDSLLVLLTKSNPLSIAAGLSLLAQLFGRKRNVDILIVGLYKKYFEAHLLANIYLQ